jgi:uncharacterized protein with GYD domain
MFGSICHMRPSLSGVIGGGAPVRSLRKGGEVMPIYIGLMKLTDLGIKHVKNAPQRVEEAVKSLEAMGGRLIGFYAVMGEYDYVAIAEAPSDEIAMTFMLGLGSAGNVRTTTLKAFTKDQLAEMVKGLP